jgi:hypothetical protein
MHEEHEKQIREKHKAQTARVPKVHSPPKVTREVFSPPRNATPESTPHSIEASIAQSAEEPTTQSDVTTLTKLSPKKTQRSPAPETVTSQTSMWEVVATRGRNFFKPTPPMSATKKITKSRTETKARAPTKPKAPASNN